MSGLKSYTEIASPFHPGKIFLYRDRLDKIIRGQIPAPVNVEIDLTTGICNHKCYYCCFGTPVAKKHYFLKKEVFPALLKELAGINVKGVELVGGGEPTIHPDILEFIDIACKNHLAVGIGTNGSLLERIFPALNKLTWLRVSLDAATSKTHSLIHRVSTNEFQRIVENIKKAVSLTKRDNLGIGFLALPENLDEIIPAAKLAKRLRVRYFQIRPALYANLTLNQLKKAKKLAEKASLLSGDNFQVFYKNIGWKHLFGKREFDKCLSSTISAVIEANGNVPFCNLKRGSGKAIVGNIYKQSFKNVWFGKRHKELLQKMTFSNCPSFCKHDLYNISIYALKEDYLHESFL